MRNYSTERLNPRFYILFMYTDIYVHTYINLYMGAPAAVEDSV